MFVRDPYNYDVNKASDESALHCLDESLAVQSQKDDADINTLVRRFGITGQMPLNVRAPTYVDFTDVIDFRTALNAIQSAERSFDSLPAEVRNRFENDPALFVDFCSNAENLAEMREMGLAVPEKVPEPKPAPVEVVIVPVDGK